MKRICWVSVLILTLLGGGVKAQYYDNGQDPFSINWEYIETKNFKIIFPSEIRTQGKIYANYLNNSLESSGVSLKHNVRQIPVIIHNQNSISNGEVAWAPKRMNLYAVEPQYGQSEPYASHLVLHEQRHFVQIDKLNNNATKVLYYLLGEQAIGGVLGWHIPLWFFEGDAVAYETGASNSGRGRDPDFSMKIKAQIDQYGLYSYPKAQFGSYKDFVPNHYELGYQLISNARMKYGSDIWADVLSQVSKSPIHVNAFSKGIKKRTGLPERKLYKTLLGNTFESNIVERADNTEYESFHSPQINKGSIISLRTNLSDIPSFVYNNYKEPHKSNTIIKPGNVFNNSFSYVDSVLIWNEYKRTRWHNRNYIRIVKYDLNKNKKTYLTTNTRAYQSKLSADKSKILSVEVDEKLNWSITIRDAESAKIIDSLLFEGVQPVQPVWGQNSNQIVYLLIDKKGKSLIVHDLIKGVNHRIINNTYAEISNPYFSNNCIFLKGVYNGVSNILCYDLSLNNWSLITNERYGVGEFSISNNELVFSTYTANGYKISRKKLSNIEFQEIDGPQMFETELTNHLNKSEEIVDFNLNDTASFTIYNYSRLKNILNVHSWAPLGIDIQNIETGPGATIMSQNELSTSFFKGGYQYNLTDKSQKYFVNYSYKGFYPVFQCDVSNVNRVHYEVDSLQNKYNADYNELSTQIGALIPVVFDKGKWYRRINGQLTYEYLSIYPAKGNLFSEHNKYNRRFSNIYYQLQFSNKRMLALRDVQTRWGQELNIRYMHSPFFEKSFGKLASAELSLYFPGLLKNHGLKLYNGIQLKNGEQLSFSDRIVYPYGYGSVEGDFYTTSHIYYHFPVIYPDLNMFEWFYFKRIKANTFYQYMKYSDGINFNSFSSAGVDVTANIHLFRFVFPLEAGLRYSRMIDMKSNYYQFLFSFTF